MRSLTACVMALALVAGEGALAQTRAPAVEKTREIDERVAFWLKTCLADWDQATHMSKLEWRTTCQRVAAERRVFLLETPDVGSIGTRRAR